MQQSSPQNQSDDQANNQFIVDKHIGSLSSCSSSAKSPFHQSFLSNKNKNKNKSSSNKSVSESNDRVKKKNFGRPSHLPPKSNEEIKKQRKLIAILEKKARRKSKNSPTSSPNPSPRTSFQLDRSNSKSRIALWKSVIVPKLLASTPLTKNEQTEFLNGVPSKIRANVWKILSSNPLQLSREHYDSLLHISDQKFLEIQAQEIGMIDNISLNNSHNPVKNLSTQSVSSHSRNEDQHLETIDLSESEFSPKLSSNTNSKQSFSTVPQKIAFQHTKVRPNLSIIQLHFKAIQSDVPRTFPLLRFFHDDGPLRKPLENILRCWSVLQPDIGYTQGLSWIAGIFLLNLDEFSAFIGLTSLILSSRSFQMVLKVSSSHVFSTLKTFDKLVLQHCPRFSTHLKKFDIPSELYAFPWFVTCFSYCLPLDLVVVIMDNILYHGFHFIFQAGVALIAYLEPFILTMDDFDDIVQFLNTLSARTKENIANQTRQPFCFESKTSSRKVNKGSKHKFKVNSLLESFVLDPVVYSKFLHKYRL